MPRYLILCLALLMAGTLSACSNPKNSKQSQSSLLQEKAAPSEKAAQVPAFLSVDADGNSSFDAEVLKSALAKKQKITLTESEVQGFKFLLEEEKLSRDINAKFFETWSDPAFDKLSASQHTHISALKAVAEKYDIDIAFYNNKLGEFSNTFLGEQYLKLLSGGKASKEEALRAATEIEETLAADLDKYLAETNCADFKLVYENLEQAARNHLRNLMRAVLRANSTYEARKLSKEKFTQIVSTSFEKGTYLTE